jgi:hypothetical protein
LPEALQIRRPFFKWAWDEIDLGFVEHVDYRVGENDEVMVSYNFAQQVCV